VRAHAIQTDLTLVGASHSHLQASVPAAGSKLELASHFSTGLPASDASVRLIPAQGGSPIELGRTNADGRLAFALPAGSGRDAEIQVDAGAGHRDWIELSELGRPARQSALPSWGALPGNLLTLAPIAALGLLAGLARLKRPRG
jgi:nickel transport protein